MAGITGITAVSERQIVLRRWEHTDDIAIIKDVATKGKYISLCIEFLANRRRCTVEASRKLFFDIVEAYINRLLHEKLVCKAETVLENVGKNFKYIYYQFAFEVDNESVREVVLGHIKKKFPDSYETDTEELRLHWQAIKDIQQNKVLFEKTREEYSDLSLERLYKLNESERNRIFAIVYFETRKEDYISKLDRLIVWNYIIEVNISSEIILWLHIFSKKKSGVVVEAFMCALQDLYYDWDIDEKMFEDALNSIKNPSEILRNSFAANGYFFMDEKDDVRKVLHRLFTTNSFALNSGVVKKLPLVKFLFENGYYTILLEESLPVEEIDHLQINATTEENNIIKLIVDIKSGRIDTDEDLAKISKTVSNFLTHSNVNFYKENPLVSVTEFLLDGSQVNELQNSNDYSIIKNVPFIECLLSRVNTPIDKYDVTINDFLKKFKEIDLHCIIHEAGNQPVSFANEMLSQRYSQNMKFNYVYYLKEQRSAYAVYALLIDQLKNYAQVSVAHLFNAAQLAIELAISKRTEYDTVCHCIAFIEMLGFDSSNLRAYMCLLRNSTTEEKENLASNSTEEKEHFENVEDYAAIIENAEKSFLQHLKEIPAGKFPSQEYGAIVKISKCFRNRCGPEIYMKELAEQNDFWKLLLLFQYFNIPLKQIKRICRCFNSLIIGQNLERALSYDIITDTSKSKRRFSKSESRRRSRSTTRSDTAVQTTSMETLTTSFSSSAEHNKQSKSNENIKFLQHSRELDIFGIILLSSHNGPESSPFSLETFKEVMRNADLYSTAINLMKNAVRYRLPILTVLAAGMNQIHINYCWALWVLLTTDDFDNMNTAQSFEDFTFNLIEKCVQKGNVRTLNKSFEIFFKDSAFIHFTNFLLKTIELVFVRNTADELINYLLALSNNDVQLPFINKEVIDKDKLRKFTIRLQIIHMRENFDSTYYQQLYLDIICRSGLSDITKYFDFFLLRNVFYCLLFTEVDVDMNILIENIGSEEKIRAEYESCCQKLLELKHFDKALELAKCLDIPIEDIIYQKWIHLIESSSSFGNFDLSLCETEAEEQSLPPEVLINFYLHIAYSMSYPPLKKYDILKKSLEVIKKHQLFPSECFDRDRIEYEMVLCFVQNDFAIEDIELYHSMYFETVMVEERYIIYKTFLELKELAGVEEMSVNGKGNISKVENDRLDILLNRYLDEGDIVQALRLQAMFDHRPLDLHFIVFCMAIAEGITNIYNLSAQERQTLTDCVRSSISIFKRRTLIRICEGSTLSLGKQNESSDTNSTSFDFEEIPSREKQDVLDALQGLASRLTHGIDIGKRIVMTYRSAMYLDKEYVDILRTKDYSLLLRSAVEENSLQKLVVLSDIFASNRLTKREIADFLATEIVTAVIRPRFYILRTDQPNSNADMPSLNMLWGYNMEREFHLILDLSLNTTLLGNTLLDYCDALKIYRKFQDNKNCEEDIADNTQMSNAFNNLKDIIRRYGHPHKQLQPQQHRHTNQVLSHKKANTITVELLIKAHQCFLHECSMEGIANVLARAKILNTILCQAKSWHLIVRMLTGIGCYREMYYCFDALMQNHQFELLLGRSDEDKVIELRQAILTYLHENCPENNEYLKMTGLSFSMHKELAEMWEIDAATAIAKVLSEYLISDQNSANITLSRVSDESSSNNNNLSFSLLTCTTDLMGQMNQIMTYYVNAAENYLVDNKLRVAQNCASSAELVAMQIDLINKSLKSQPPRTTCVCVLKVSTAEAFRDLVNKELNVPQSMILKRSSDFEINWIEAILNQYLIQGNDSYLVDYCDRMDLTDTMIENLTKSFQLQTKLTKKMEDNMAKLIEMVQSITLKYKLASICGFKHILSYLINGEAVYYLKDTNYGKNEINFSKT